MNQPAPRPVVASYCATFLKPEMLHLYRQITGLTRVRPVVIAQKRENADRFPFNAVTIVPKSSLHFLRRIWYRQLRDIPWQISHSEVAALRRALADTGAELLHIYFGHIAVHLLPLIRAWERPSVVSFHGADVLVDLDKPAYRTATREVLQAIRLVLVRSESLGRALVDLGCPPAKIRLQRTGIPLDDIPFRARAWPNDGRWRLLQAGRLIAKKGIETSLRTFAQFAQRHPNATFTIAGEGPLRAALGQLAAELQIGSRITFAGFISQVQLRELFYQSHLFLHPSETGADGNQEGVPNAMLEAMASGLPVFATRHGGIPEAIENGISGMLVAERDDDALAQALLQLADQPAQLTALAQRGAEAVAEKFETRAQVRQLEDYYFEAMAMR
ncbi:MAG: glycosyltransferase [Chthoniobacterales bacterium]